MPVMTSVNRSQVQQALSSGNGLLRLEPSWVPRSFMIPGRRLKLHPDDLYACGAHRGGINERWFASTTNADNGPGTPADEGLSYVRLPNGTVDKWFAKAGVDLWEDMPAEAVAKCIEYVKNRLPSNAAA